MNYLFLLAIYLFFGFVCFKNATRRGETKKMGFGVAIAWPIFFFGMPFYVAWEELYAFFWPEEDFYSDMSEKLSKLSEKE